MRSRGGPRDRSVPRRWSVHALARAAFVTAVALLTACGSSSSHTSHTGAPTSAGPSAKTSTSTPLTTTTTVTYRVKSGDTLGSIARRFHVAVSAITSVNHITNPDRLPEGQTLRIPPRPPLGLVVTPASGPPGQAFQLRLTGARPSETITFEVDAPKGKFTGPPHTADAGGSVTATYQTSITDPAGTFNVIAHGNAGTTAHVAFAVAATTDHT